MEDNQTQVKNDESLILELLKKHSSNIEIDINEFCDLLKHSLSLNTMEKKRVIDAVPTLSQFQFDELKKVFVEERGKFRDLAKEHPEDIKKLLSKQQLEWSELGALYKNEIENKAVEGANQNKIDDIKAGLGL